MINEKINQSKILDNEYYKAKQDRTVRQSFLESIDLTGSLISKLVYIESVTMKDLLKYGFNDRVAQTDTHTFQQFSPIRKRPVYVFPHAFSEKYCQVLGDLLSVIFDHEAFHILQGNANSLILAYRHLRAMTSGSAEIVEKDMISTELPAYENQIKNADDRKLSDKYKSILEQRIDDMIRKWKPISQITDNRLFYDLIPNV